MKFNLKTIALALGAVLLVLQFIRPAKNNSGENQHDIRTKYEVPADVQQILAAACNDCHTNNTRYPWYSNIQPVGLWLQNHVNGGKKSLNFSEFTKRKIAVQNHKLEEIIEVLEEHKMPLNSYTWTHADARLSEAQKKTVMQWAKAQMDMLSSKYPADSLVLKRNH